MSNASSGYQPDTKSPSARRADFDLLRRNTSLQNRIEADETRLATAEAKIAVLEPKVAALETKVTALEAKTATTAWMAVTFINSWTNYGLGYQNMQYRKVGDLVQLRGVIKSGTLNTIVFTLPVGFCPPATVQATMNDSTAGSALLEIRTNGQCVAYVTSNAAISILHSFSVT